jgi:photosystem II stability/assembly factor-like uncharacterized protein
MSEPIMRRTQSGPAEKIFRPLNSLAKVLSLCSVLSVLAFVSAPLQAETQGAVSSGHAIESAKAQYGLMVDVVKAGQRLVAVGERGHILYSDDQGASWSQAKVPSQNLLTSVFFADDKHGWAVGHDAVILASSDGGATWVEQHRDIEREEGAPFLDVWFKDATTGYVVGAYNALLETLDGGQTWNDVSDRLDNEDGYHLNALAPIKDAGLFAVGEMGVMFRSADWGQSWEKVSGPYQGSLFGVQGTQSASTLLVFGLRGNMFRSTDFGNSWKPVKIEVSRGTFQIGLSGASLAADGSIIVVGHGGAVLRSTDDGRTFSVFNRPDRLSLSAVTIDGKGDLVLVGQGGVRLASPTGAALVQQ